MFEAWSEHAVRILKMRNAYTILGLIVEWKISIGRPIWEWDIILKRILNEQDMRYLSLGWDK